MARYALFLRGINVGGIRVSMPELRSVLETMGCTGVQTWLNTGNVVLDDARDPKSLKGTAEATIGEAFGYDAHVLLRSLDWLKHLVRAWPYDADATYHRYVVFGGATALEEILGMLAPDAAEAVTSIGDDLLWHCPKGSSTTSVVAKVLSKKHLKPLVTTRNLNTVEKMLAG